MCCCSPTGRCDACFHRSGRCGRRSARRPRWPSPARTPGVSCLARSMCEPHGGRFTSAAVRAPMKFGHFCWHCAKPTDGPVPAGCWLTEPADTAVAMLALAQELQIEFVWLPRQWPALNAMDQLWKELKRDVAANRQAASIDDLADHASQWVLNLTPAQARRKSGMASSRFWLRSLSQDFWLPT